MSYTVITDGADSLSFHWNSSFHIQYAIYRSRSKICNLEIAIINYPDITDDISLIIESQDNLVSNIMTSGQLNAPQTEPENIFHLILAIKKSLRNLHIICIHGKMIRHLHYSFV